MVSSDDFIDLEDVDKLSNHCDWVMFEYYLLYSVFRQPGQYQLHSLDPQKN